MRKSMVVEFGKSIMSHLHGAERADDQGLSSHAKLFAALLDARLGLNLAQCSERTLVNETAKLLVNGIARREEMIELHSKYAAVAERLRIDPSAFGDGGAKSDVVMPQPSGTVVTMPARSAA